MPLQFLLSDVLLVVYSLFSLLYHVLNDLLLNDDLFRDLFFDVYGNLDDLFDTSRTGVVLARRMMTGPSRVIYFTLLILFGIPVAPHLIVNLETTFLCRGYDLRSIHLHTLLMDCNAHLPLLTLAGLHPLYLS